ncbi:MAG: nitroreductase family protein [Alphaproteobacteria bacterium]|nr:nitroreductase family protein [Alphaproteobacteria bacterium]
MSHRDESANLLTAALHHRFGEEVAVDPALPDVAALARQANHRSHRRFTARRVDASLLRLLCAVALSAPTKSDLQQRDIIVIEDPAQRRRVLDLIPDNEWTASAPALLVFCGNNRRQRQLHAWRGRPFANDHLDAMFNAAVDCGIALAAFVVAAEAAGLGCCPISAIRNHARLVSDVLSLPDHVFPVAGLGVGWPADAGTMSLRLPLSVTVHRDRFAEDDVRARIEAYERRRAAAQPYARQRYADEYGTAQEYGWSEDKARQYSKPERAEFGAFLRLKGFQLT